MNRLQQRILANLIPDPDPNAHLLCIMRTGPLLPYWDIQARLRERDIGERDIGDGHFGERDIGETVNTSRFAE